MLEFIASQLFVDVLIGFVLLETVYFWFRGSAATRKTLLTHNLAGLGLLLALHFAIAGENPGAFAAALLIALVAHIAQLAFSKEQASV